MDKELFLMAHDVAEQHLHSDGLATYSLYEALERAYALGVKDHTDDARRTSYADGFNAGVEEGAFKAYLDCELNGTGPLEPEVYRPKLNAQVEGFDYPEPRVIYVDSHGVAMTEDQYELHTAVAALGG
jgi:hypothetical protein